MRILFNSLVNDASISATNESLNYPATNLQHPYIKRRFQATGTSSTITLTYTADITTDCFFWSLTNATSITVTFKNSGGGTIDTINISSPNGRTEVEYIDSISNVRSIEIALTGSSDVYIRGIGVGAYYQNLNFLSG